VSVVVVEPVITKTIPKNADSLMNVHHLGEKRKADANKPSSSSKKKVPAVEVESAESDASQDADGTVAYNNQTTIASQRVAKSKAKPNLSVEIRQFQEINDVLSPRLASSVTINANNVTELTSIEKEMLKAEYSISDIMRISSSKKLGKKVFLVNGIIKKFTNSLHWFSSERILRDVDPYKLPVAFTCKCCKMVLKAPFPKFTNLTHHLSLNNHLVYQKWKLLQHADKVLISDPVRKKTYR